MHPAPRHGQAYIFSVGLIDMLEIVEEAFAPELLGVSHKAAALADFAWIVFRAGMAVPLDSLRWQFPDADGHVSVLSKAGIMRYSLGGFINRDQKKESLSVYADEDVAKACSQCVRRKEFGESLFRNFGKTLAPYCRTDLTEMLAVMLTSLIYFATPTKPALVSTVVRKASKICLKDYTEASNALDYYLNRFLGLVTYESGSLINLSVRSQQRVRGSPKIWAMYLSQPTEKQKDEITKPVPKPVPSSEASQQERKLKGYFPWIRF